MMDGDQVQYYVLYLGWQLAEFAQVRLLFIQHIDERTQFMAV